MAAVEVIPLQAARDASLSNLNAGHSRAYPGGSKPQPWALHFTVSKGDWRGESGGALIINQIRTTANRRYNRVGRE